MHFYGREVKERENLRAICCNRRGSSFARTQRWTIITVSVCLKWKTPLLSSPTSFSAFYTRENFFQSLTERVVSSKASFHAWHPLSRDSKWKFVFTKVLFLSFNFSILFSRCRRPLGKWLKFLSTTICRFSHTHKRGKQNGNKFIMHYAKMHAEARKVHEKLRKPNALRVGEREKREKRDSSHGKTLCVN